MNRYYGSARGQFVSVDKASFVLFVPNTLNRYLYIHNDPINSSDSTGEFAYIPVPKPRAPHSQRPPDPRIFGGGTRNGTSNNEPCEREVTAAEGEQILANAESYLSQNTEYADSTRPQIDRVGGGAGALCLSFDCSGFVTAVLALPLVPGSGSMQIGSTGLRAPTVDELAREVTANGIIKFKNIAGLRAGDLVFFQEGRFHHVGFWDPRRGGSVISATGAGITRLRLVNLQPDNGDPTSYGRRGGKRTL